MGYPSISNTATSYTNSSQNFNASLPSGIQTGQLLLLFVFTNGLNTVTTPSGWTQLATTSTGSTLFHMRGYLFGKIATGSEGSTVTLQGAYTVGWGAISCSVASWFGGISGVSVNISTGNSQADADPPNLTTSWGSDENLWLAVASQFRVYDNGSVTYPSNYTLNQLSQSWKFDDGETILNAISAFAGRTLIASSENPSAFTFQYRSGDYVAFTVAVRPLSTKSTLFTFHG